MCDRVVGRQLVRLALALVCVATALAATAVLASARVIRRPAAGEHAAVVGGTTTSIGEAPWTVWVLTDHLPSDPQEAWLCSGEILSATQIITAAHCAVDPDTNQPIPASDITVTAGISNFEATEPSDQQQQVSAASVRIHPGYVASTNEKTPADDVAVLTLGAPLSLSTAAGTTAEAIALETPGAEPVFGTPLSLSGFGLENASAEQPDGSLNSLAMTAQFSPYCAGSGTSAIVLCADSSVGSPCEGDSGGPLVSDTAPPLLVGIESLGAAGCLAGDLNIYTDVAAPEIQDFIDGSSAPPAAPRGGLDITWSVPPSTTGQPQVGQTMTCNGGTWSNNATLGYKFIVDNSGSANDDGTGLVLQSGAASTYVFTTSDIGDAVYCLVTASNAGGTGSEDTVDTPPVTPAPVVITTTATTTAVTMSSSPVTSMTTTAVARSTPAPAPNPITTITGGVRTRSAALVISANHRSLRPGASVAVRLRLTSGSTSLTRVPVCVRVPGGLRVTGVGGGRASAGTVCWTASLHPNTYGVFTIALTLGSSVSAGHVALSATAQIGRSDRLRATTTITIT